MLDALSVAPTFFAYVVLVAGIVAAALVRWLSGPARIAALAVLVAWFADATVLGYIGVVANARLPVPGLVVLLGPIVAVAILLVRSRAGLHLSSVVPLQVLIGLQVFRVGVEATLHRLWELGTVPKLMTLSGGNVDILIGLSAPFAAWIATRGSGGRRIAVLWNAAGLASLLNVAARAALTAPGPLNALHGDVLNTALGTFPFTFIPGFMAPLAMMLHVLAFRALGAARGTARDERSAAVPVDA